MKMNRLQTAVLIAACSMTVLLRTQDLPLHLDSMIALALLCGAVVRHPIAVLIPLGVRLLTDLVLWSETGYGFYPSIVLDYAAYLLIAVLARFVPLPKAATMIGGGLVGPVLFFLISNFGVWSMWPETYPHTISGLLSCYAQGLPFLRDSLIGNAPFALLFLAAWHVATVSAPAESLTVAGADSQQDA